MADNRISETRQSAEADRKEDDPLAELARIVGFDDKENNASDSDGDDGQADSGFDLEAELMRELEIDVAGEGAAAPQAQPPEAPLEQVQENIQSTSSKRVNDRMTPVQPEADTGSVPEDSDAWPHASAGATAQMTSLEAELQAAFSALEGDARKPEPEPAAQPDHAIQPDPRPEPVSQPFETGQSETVRMPEASTEPLEGIAESDDLKQAYERLQRDIDATKSDEPAQEGGSLTDMLLAEMAEVEAQASEAVADVPDVPFDPADIAETDAAPEAMSEFAVPDYGDGDVAGNDPNRGDFGLPLEDELDVLSGQDTGSAMAEAAEAYTDASSLHGNAELEPATLDSFDDHYQARNVSAVNSDYDDPATGGYDDDYDPDVFPGDDDFTVDDLAAPDFEGADEDRGGRRGMVAAIVVLAIAVGGGGGFYLWNSSLGSGAGDPPVIAANNDPVKVKPEDPGGKTVPNQDLAVYDKVSGNETSGAAEQGLVTTTEEPVDVVQRTLDPDTLPLEGRAAAEAPVAKVEERLAATAPLDPDPRASEGASAGIAPRKVRTLVVRPDGTIVAREEPEPADRTAAVSIRTTPSAAPADASGASALRGNTDTAVEQQIASTRALDTTTADTSAAPANQVAVLPPIDDNLRDTGALPLPLGRPAAAAGAATQSRSAATGDAPVPSTRPAEQPVTIVEAVTERGNLAGSPPVANPGGYMMQISSQPSEAAARESYDNLSQRYVSIIGGKGVDFQRADIPNRGVFYRVRIPAGSRSEANNLCAQYKAAGGSCFVAR